MIIRTYTGSSQARAAEKMAGEGAPAGHHLGGQSWAPGGRTCAAQGFVVLGVVLLVVGLFFLPLWALAVVCLVIGLVSGREEGELTVTWEPDTIQMTGTLPQMRNAPSADPASALASLKTMLDSGLITQDEYDAKKADVISRL